MTELSKADLREVQLSILDQVDDFCHENGITYHLAFGTLLGAIRYGSYIPWDDDLDLTMPRDDYDRFCTLFRPDDCPLTLGSPETTDGWAYPFAKVWDRRTVLIEETELEHQIGVNVDIFPVDHYPATPFARRWHIRHVSLLKAILILKSVKPSGGRARRKALVLMVAKPVVRRIPNGALGKRIARAAASHARQSNRVSVTVGPYVWDVDESALATSAEVAFEGRRAPAPVGHHDVLSAIYGRNYIEPPPQDQRLTHHDFTARWV